MQEHPEAFVNLSVQPNLFLRSPCWMPVFVWKPEGGIEVGRCCWSHSFVSCSGLCLFQFVIWNYAAVLTGHCWQCQVESVWKNYKWGKEQVVNAKKTQTNRWHVSFLPPDLLFSVVWDIKLAAELSWKPIILRMSFGQFDSVVIGWKIILFLCLLLSLSQRERGKRETERNVFQIIIFFRGKLK